MNPIFMVFTVDQENQTLMLVVLKMRNQSFFSKNPYSFILRPTGATFNCLIRCTNSYISPQCDPMQGHCGG